MKFFTQDFPFVIMKRRRGEKKINLRNKRKKTKNVFPQRHSKFMLKKKSERKFNPSFISKKMNLYLMGKFRWTTTKKKKKQFKRYSYVKYIIYEQNFCTTKKKTHMCKTWDILNYLPWRNLLLTS